VILEKQISEQNLWSLFLFVEVPGRPFQSLSFEPGFGIFREARTKFLYFMKINESTGT
jgi:hypothetical protein